MIFDYGVQKFNAVSYTHLHHECEIAQSVASQGDDMVHYWMHNNMITINGQKMCIRDRLYLFNDMT